MADDTNVEKKLGKIEVLALRDATGIVDNKIVGLFQDNTDLKYVYCHFPILENGSKMFWGCENLETFFTNSPDYVGILPNLENGSGMFYYTKLSEFATELPKMSNGSKMFEGCSNLKTFKSNLKALENYQEMFKADKLNLFEANEINVTDTGAQFMTNSGLSDSKNTLTSFSCSFPNMTNTDNMFSDFTSLINVQGDFSNVTSAYCMFYNCKSLKTCPTNFSSLTSAKMMFECSSIDKIPCTFPNITEATQMFCECGINGHLEVNCPIQFENLTGNVRYMFGFLSNLTSVNFDVSSISNGNQMFDSCPNLTTCTGANFQNNGSYQNMFQASKFDQESAQRIFYYAKLANVASLHIGIGFQLTETEGFAKDYNLYKWHDGENYIDDQWCESYKYCHCHNPTDEKELINKHNTVGLEHCGAQTAQTNYLQFPNIIFKINAST